MRNRHGAPFWYELMSRDPLAARIVQAGGNVVNGPMAVPGGGWILNAIDLEGALFALTGTR